MKAELGLPPEATFTTVSEADKQRFLREVIARTKPRFPEWQKETIKEMRELLVAALKIPNQG